MFFGVNLPYDPMPFWWQYTAPAKQPHKCPVCSGRGKVPASFYGPTIPPGVCVPSVTAPLEEPCRSCNGTGVLWG